MEVLGKVELVTRDIAHALLASMVPNRHIRIGKVDQYKSDMVAARFLINGQGLVISDQGHLMDGQNRLTAFLATGFPQIKLFIVRGVEEEAFGTLDSGAARTLADFVQIEKLMNSKVLSGIARLAYNYAAGWFSSATPSRPALLDFVHRHTERLIEAAAWATASRAHVRTSPFGTVLFLATEAGRYHDEAREFVQGVSTGADLSVGDPRHTLREWVVKGMKKHGSTALTAEMVFGATIRTWNAYVSGRPITIIRELSQVTVRAMPIIGYQQWKFPEVPLSAKAEAEPAKRPYYGKKSTAKLLASDADASSLAIPDQPPRTVLVVEGRLGEKGGPGDAPAHS